MKFQRNKTNENSQNSTYFMILALGTLLSMSYYLLSLNFLTDGVEYLVKIKRPIAKNDIQIDSKYTSKIKIGWLKKSYTQKEAIQINDVIANLDDIERSVIHTIEWNSKQREKQYILLEIDKNIQMGIIQDIQSILREVDERKVCYLTY